MFRLAWWGHWFALNSSRIILRSFYVLILKNLHSRYTLKNSAGVEVKIINFGGIIVSINVPDKNGDVDDVITGFDNIAGKEIHACLVL